MKAGANDDLRLLSVFTREEFVELAHWLKTGKRFSNVLVTDEWIEENLRKASKEILSLADSLDVHDRTLNDNKCLPIVAAAKDVVKEHRRGLLSAQLEAIERLQIAFERRRKKKRT